MNELSSRCLSIVAMLQSGRLDEAEKSLLETFREFPEHPEVFRLFGHLKRIRRDWNGAENAFAKAIENSPECALYFFDLGELYRASNRTAQAIACWRAAIQCEPSFQPAIASLWRALIASNVSDASLLGLLEATPGDHAQWKEFATLALAAERRDLAADCLVRLVRVSPEAADVDTIERMGELLLAGKRPQFALELFESLGERIAASPRLQAQWYRVLLAGGDIERATEVLARLRMQSPESITWELREATLCPPVFDSSAALDEYRERLAAHLEKLKARSEKLLKRDVFEAGFMPPFVLAFQGRNDRPLKEAFAAIARSAFSPLQVRGAGGRKRRIGILVTSGNEPNFLRSMQKIIAGLDRSRFEAFVFAHTAGSRLIEHAFQGTQTIIVTFDNRFNEACRRIAEANCDVIYYWEIGSDQLNYSLPFMRLAPIQLTSWATQSTTGMHEVDYYLSSRWVEDASAQENYTERLYLLESLPTIKSRVSIPTGSVRDSLGIPRGVPLYLCPQTIIKMHPEQDALFLKVLRADPQGRLVIRQGLWAAATKQLLRRIDRTLAPVRDRIHIVPWLEIEDYYRLIADADVVLDPLHFSAGSSAYDMFSAAAPVVTLPGNTFVSRYTSACYRLLEAPELIAADHDDYVSKAVSWANNPELARSIRKLLQDRSERLFEEFEVIDAFNRFFVDAEMRR